MINETLELEELESKNPKKPKKEFRPFPWENLDIAYVRFQGQEVWGTDNGETSNKNHAFSYIDGKPRFEQPKSMLEFVRTKRDCIIIVDAAIYSYQHDKRLLLLSEAAANNITLLGKQTRHEARLRTELDIDKSDENDAQLAYYIARHTKFAMNVLRALPPPVFLHEEPRRYAPGTKVIETWQDYANYHRRIGTQLYQSWVKDFLADVPSFKDLLAEIATPLGNSDMNNYDRDFILLVVAVSREANMLSSTGDEFQAQLGRLWGWYSGGHRGYARSTFYRRAVTLAKREVKPRNFSDIAWLEDGSWKGDLALRRKYLKGQQQDLRRAVRFVSSRKP